MTARKDDPEGLRVTRQGISLIQFATWFAALVFSVGVCYATLSTKVSALEEASDQRQSDHDCLVALITRVDSMRVDILEIKADVKQIVADRP